MKQGADAFFPSIKLQKSIMQFLCSYIEHNSNWNLWLLPRRLIRGHKPTIRTNLMNLLGQFRFGVANGHGWPHCKKHTKNVHRIQFHVWKQHETMGHTRTFCRCIQTRAIAPDWISLPRLPYFSVLPLELECRRTLKLAQQLGSVERTYDSLKACDNRHTR